MQKTMLRNAISSPKQFCFVALFLLVSQICFAQSNVSGTVKDTNKLPLPGVNVLVKGTGKGVVTDFDGAFSITVSDSDVLIFSYMGYVNQEVNVNGRRSIDIIMKEDIESLDEVVVIGYGSQLKEDISGAVATVEVEDLQTIPQVSVDQMIQGRASGVSVTTNSGQPGAAVSVRIRGVNSISGSSEPLYIIDGVPVPGESVDGGTSPLNSINQNDIESVNILKDASATAIYGSRGSNGVVIITTKRGKKSKGTVSYNSFIAIQEPTNIIDVLTLPEYAELQNAINDIYGIDPIVEYTRPELLGEGTNWQQEIFDNAPMESHQISFQGGKEGLNYFISAGHLEQEGTVIASGFNRSTVRANVDAKISDKIKVGVNVTASRVNEKITLNGRSDGIIGLSLLNNPAIAVFNPDGSFAGPSLSDDFRTENPIAKALSLRNNLRRNRILGNIYAEVKIAKNLTYRTEFGGDFGTTLNSQFTPRYSYGEIEVENNTLSVANNYNDFWIIKNFLTYSNTFNGKHDLTVLLGAESQEASFGGVTSTDGNFVGNDFPILGTGDADDNSTQFKGSQALESYFGRAIYSFDNKYSVTASLRADGSSKFAAGNKWGYFPSISGAWKLSNEPFMQGVDAIQNIKIYGGYGEVGNQNIPNFAYGSRLNPVNTGLGTGFLVTNFANPDLTWESSTQTNIGVDFSLFDRKLNASVELYEKVSKDFLYQFASTNFITGGMAPGAIQAPWVNLGEMVNKGIDVTLNYSTDRSKDFSWNSSLTVSHYKNEVTDLGNVPKINGAMNINYDGQQNITITRAGDPLGLFYGLEVEGIFRSVDDFEGAAIQYGRPFEDALFATTWLGDIKFKDQNNDGVIDDNDRTIIGNPHPDFTFGFQNSFKYKSFDLSVFLQGSYGNDVFNGIGRLLTAGNRTYTNQLSSVLDYWSVDNPDATAPRLARNDTRNIEISDRYIEDGSYLRIQNVTLGYTLNSKITDKIGLTMLKVYGSIQNLYTFTDYSGYDPEIGSFNQNTLLTGIDAGRYPSPRTYTFGVNVEF
ncbi:TonB-dependent receptor [Flavivirga abyssicola]|uniref:SusC/RagA family TonB-linked outer membrane protein n=1 Tax=Flavivirga abyssicola TaxID=3063533 RepID=UPI0026E06E2D|nr:TonB-dependent receptor [Flavivirga sp. MEBiC07777]WVK12587.1 TonB-dependent receptor [Flavivirga sp. MEBiC07777]